MMSTDAMAFARRRFPALIAVTLMVAVLPAAAGRAGVDDGSSEGDAVATAQAEVRTLSSTAEATGQLVRSDVATVGHGGAVSVGAGMPGGARGAQAADPAASTAVDTAAEVTFEATSSGGVVTSALFVGTAFEPALVSTRVAAPAIFLAANEEPTEEVTAEPTEEATDEPTPPTSEEPTESGGLSVDPAALDFGTVTMGEVELASVTVTNSGQDTIMVGAQVPRQGRFSVDLDEPVALEPGGTLRLTVAFAPDQPGRQDSELRITADGVVDATVPLTGIGDGEEPGDPTPPDPTAPDPTSPTPPEPGAGQDRPAGGAPTGGMGGGAPTEGMGAGVGGVARQAQSPSAPLGGGIAEMLEGRNSATLTWLLERGAAVDAGTVLYTADAEPVATIIGATPIWRTLERDVTGEDVAMLQDNLIELGHLDAEHTSGTFDAATEAAVEAWETELGRGEPDGDVTLGEVAVLARPGTVIEHLARTGDTLLPATPVLTVGTAPDTVTLDVPVGDLATWPLDATVEVSWTDGGTAAGRVVAIGTEVEGSGSEATVAVTVSLDAPTPTRPEGAAVTATTTEFRDAVLAVPVAAIVSGADGEPAVRLAGSGSTIVPVTLGLVDGGWIQIRSGLDEGQTVRLPGSTTLP